MPVTTTMGLTSAERVTIAVLPVLLPPQAVQVAVQVPTAIFHPAAVSAQLVFTILVVSTVLLVSIPVKPVPPAQLPALPARAHQPIIVHSAVVPVPVRPTITTQVVRFVLLAITLAKPVPPAQPPAQLVKAHQHIIVLSAAIHVLV